MEYREIKNRDGKTVFVSVNKNEISADFDTGITRVEVSYHSAAPTDSNLLYGLTVNLSREFIDDTYHLRGPTSEAMKIKACLDVASRAFEEKQDQLHSIETIIATTASSRLRYIPRIDMQPVESH